MPSVFPALKAGTLAELAGMIGVPGDALECTVKEFNGSVVRGKFNPEILDDCRTEGIAPPKSHWARPIDVGPFLAYPLRPGITFTYLGVQVNGQGAVCMNGAHSPNIFAAGEIMAGNILGQGYLAGFGMTIGTVFGRIAGREAALAVR